MKNRSRCPINYGLEHFGDYWSLLIIRDLMFKGKRHYNEFLNSEENISTSVLRDKLRLLEDVGFITKQQDLVKKSRILYNLTEKGISTLPMMVEIIIWSAHFDSKTSVEQDFLEQVFNDKEKLLLQLLQKLRAEHLTN